MNLKLRKFIIFCSFILIGYVIAFIIPFYWNVALLAIIIFAPKYKDKICKIGIILSGIIRLIIVACFLLFIYEHPHYIPLQKQHPKIYFFILGSEVGLFEKIVGHYTSLIKSENSDIFIKSSFKFNGKYTYSVGPDGVDDKLEVIYDPTNGTMSRGDIIVYKYEKTRGPLDIESHSW